MIVDAQNADSKNANLYAFYSGEMRFSLHLTNVCVNKFEKYSSTFYPTVNSYIRIFEVNGATDRVVKRLPLTPEGWVQLLDAARSSEQIVMGSMWIFKLTNRRHANKMRTTRKVAIRRLAVCLFSKPYFKMSFVFLRNMRMGCSGSPFGQQCHTKCGVLSVLLITEFARRVMRQNWLL